MGVPEQIAAANAAADAASEKAITYAESAMQEAQSFVIPADVTPVVAPIVNPPAYDPNTHLSTEFDSDFSSIWGDMEAWVKNLMQDWINTNFPMLDPAIATAENTWLLNVVNNGYEGIPAAVEAAIWDRARSKELKEAIRMEEEATTQMSSRGFSLPSGVLAGRMIDAQHAASDKISTLSRDLAIKQTEIMIEMTKLAITEMTKLRIGMAGALADFIRAWMTMPTAAAEIAKAKAAMHQMLWQSSADYARAQVAVASLDLDAQKTNSSLQVQNAATYTAAFNKGLEMRVNSALSSAHEMGVIAAASRGAQNTLVGSVTNIAQIG